MLPEENKNHEFVATTLEGLEQILAEELLKIGARDIVPVRRAVRFNGDLGFLYKANKGLRTALRILFPVLQGNAANEQEYYDRIASIPWHKWIKDDQTFAVQAILNNAPINHSHFAALKAKDAIADRIKKERGTRPSIDTANPHWSIHILWNKNRLQVSLDSSGKPLYKRGYKVAFGKAPLNECLASGIVLASGWNGNGDVLDPFCGSGTLLTEAAMIAMNMPAGMYRSEYGFMNWPNFNPELYDIIVNGMVNRIKETQYSFYGYDLNRRAVEDAQANIENAMMEDYIKIRVGNFKDIKKPTAVGQIFTNPPYNTRISAEVVSLYGEIGTWLKHEFTGWSASILAPDEEIQAWKHIGLKANRKVPLLNGSISCKLMNYHLFSGGRKSQ
ncbi:MAG TPA: RNA methyltransferase [Flavobacteriales bacterium]|jgi:putative N6-adenine-specific DNA methylase|nr:RNA methyltransferase [Flavobacteriales bacterium]